MFIWPDKIEQISQEEYLKFFSKRNINSDGEGNSGLLLSRKLNREVQYESELECKFYIKLEKSDEVLYYQEQPFKIPYVFNGKSHNYIPDCFLVLKNGRGIVVEIKPELNMMQYGNICKWIALQDFCREKGLGCLMTTGNRSIQYFSTFKYNKEFEKKNIELLKG